METLIRRPLNDDLSKIFMNGDAFEFMNALEPRLKLIYSNVKIFSPFMIKEKVDIFNKHASESFGNINFIIYISYF
jgi:hypothetical protein